MFDKQDGFNERGTYHVRVEFGEATWKYTVSAMLLHFLAPLVLPVLILISKLRGKTIDFP